VADDDHGAATAGGRSAHVLGGRARGEAVVDLGLAEPERARRLARAQQWAGEDHVRREAVLAELLAEPARLVAAVRRQRPQLVGGSRRSLGVSDDHEAHRGQDSLAPVSELVERYLLLGLRLGRHIDGFVDAYYGPPELAERADAVDPAQLAVDAAALREQAGGEYLRAQLLGCETTARRLAGEPIGWAEEVEQCYGVRPEHIDESRFERAHERLDEALPGSGDLGERYRAWTETQAVPPDKLLAAAQRFEDLLRARTAELFGLPDGESTELEAVRNEPWSAFNYYLGRRRSRVVVNTDLPVYAFRLPELIAHELYPGHHTEHAWKEALLVDGEERLEETIFLTGTPQAVVSEGIASLAPEIVDAHTDAADTYAELGIEYDEATADAVRAARDDLDGLNVNAGRLLHVDGRSRDEVVDYIERWSLVPRAHAEKSFEFISHPTWRAYMSCYTSGYELCERWVAGDAKRFRSLLTEQFTTSDLRA
jgi:hypothetical protein